MRYFLELCLKSVEAAIQDIDAEIIVVDNDSKDDSCQMVEALFPKVRLIKNSENYGFSKGNNIGVQVAKGEYLCILNPDTVVGEQTFKSLIAYADLQKDLGIIGCRLIDGQGRFLPESKRNIPIPSVAIKKILGYSNSYYANHIGEFDTGAVSVFVGAFMLIKRHVYLDVGGLDEDYFMYGEDIDLSFKVEKAGYTNRYCGSTTVIHYKGESTLKDKTYAKRFYGAMQIFYNKHFRSNIFFDALVWFGIKLARFTSRNQNIQNHKPSMYKLVSRQSSAVLEGILETKLELIPSIETFENDVEYIFDNNDLSFDEIISTLSENPKNSKATFKILPKNSTFIIGSNSSKRQGEMLLFANN